MKVILKTRNISKNYGQNQAVSDLNITVKEGEIYGFLGRNGAGKTTTILMLLGLIKPTTGSVEIFGEDFLGAKRKILPRIGSLIDFAGFYPNLTAAENLKINCRLLGVQKKAAIDEALETVGLWDERNRQVRNFSLGMKQRLGIARAIIHHPELLILDEPTNGLDPVGIKEVRKLIKTLAEKRKITIFMSSHILSEVQQLATKIGIINRGKLIEEISIEELRKRNRRYIEVRVSNDGKAVMLLEQKFKIFDYEVHEEGVIRVYEQHDRIGEINHLFVENEIIVTGLTLSEDNLEDYFVRVTGGEIID